jgi:hypothetical protein
VTFLAAEAFHFSYGHAFNAQLGEGFLDLLELERLDDRFQFFHVDVVARLFTSSEAERGTRFINNALVRLQTRNFCNHVTKFFAKTRGCLY